MAIRRSLAERDRKIAELEAQVAKAFKSTEAAEGLSKQIEEMKAAADAERTGFELKLAGCRSVRAGQDGLRHDEGGHCGGGRVFDGGVRAYVQAGWGKIRESNNAVLRMAPWRTDFPDQERPA